jgi:hypothetical protein
VGWAGDVSHMGEMRSSYKILSQKIWGNERNRLEELAYMGRGDSIKINFKDMRKYLGRSNAGTVGSNPTGGMDVCVRLFCVCVGSGLATGWSLVQRVLPNLYTIHNFGINSEFIGKRTETSGEVGSCEQGNGPSGSMKVE